MLTCVGNKQRIARAKSISPRVFAKSTAVEYSPGAHHGAEGLASRAQVRVGGEGLLRHLNRRVRLHQALCTNGRRRCR